MAEKDSKQLKTKKKPTSGLKKVIRYIAGIAFVAILAIWGKSTYLFRIEGRRNNVNMRDFSDLSLIVLAAIGHYLLDVLITKSITGWITRRVMRSNIKRKEYKIKRSIKQFKSFLVYTIGFFVGLYGTWGYSGVPRHAGGTQKTCWNIFCRNWPRTQQSPRLRIYIIIESGYHLKSLVYYGIFMRNDRGYFEMMTHHVCTCLAMVYSYLVNLEDFTAYVMLMSNVADIFFNLGRFFRDAAYGEFLTMTTYAFIVVLWFVSRLYLLPVCFYQATRPAYVKDVPYDPFDEELVQMWRDSKVGMHLVIISIWIITVLNVFWFYLIVSAGVKRLLGVDHDKCDQYYQKGELKDGEKGKQVKKVKVD